MITAIKNWWIARQARLNEVAFREGYEYAARELLLSHKTVEQLEIESDDIFDGSDVSRSFDKGVDAACRDWESVAGLDKWGMRNDYQFESECG